MSFIIARFRHLALIMITLGFGLLLLELANSASWLTGGADGLQGVKMWPLLGLFKFDLWGVTAYWYSLIVLFVLFLVSRRLINSPFGLSLRGIRENAVRMRAIGAESRPHIRKIYTISAAMAGVAGAILTQTTETVSLGVLSFERSADVLVMLILGGAGPALRRADRRDHLHDRARLVLRRQSAILVPADRRAADRGRAVPAERHPRRRFAAREHRARPALVRLAHLAATVEARRMNTPASTPALSTSGLNKRFGSLVVANEIGIALPQGVRYALIGPNGAGKTTLINLMTGMLRPDGGHILLGGEDITALGPGGSGSAAGWCAPSRSTACSRISTRWKR